MTYRTDIPGQISEFQLKAIELIASNIDAGSLIVELGSLFGRSSYAWAKSCEGRASVVCIDPFSGNEGVKRLAEAHGITYSRETFESYVSDCSNIEVIQGFSPQVVAGKWNRPVHVYFDDSVHQNPGFIKNLMFWKRFLVAGGILCGDDFRPRFQDIVREVEKQAEEANYKLILVDFMWVLLPPASAFFDVELLEKGLRELGAAADAKRKVFKGVHPEGLVNARSVGKRFVISYRFSNTSAEPIDIRCMHGDDDVEFHVDQLLPLGFDIPATIEIVLPGAPQARVKLCLEGVEHGGRQEVVLCQPYHLSQR